MYDVGVVDPGAEDLAGQRRRPGHRGRQFAARRSRRTESDGRQQVWHRHRPDRALSSAQPMPIGPKAKSRADRNAWQISTTDQLFKANQYMPLIVAYQNGAPVRLSDLGHGDGFG